MKSIGVIGAISGVGTTMIAQSIAETYKELGLSVLLIFASSNYDDQYVEKAENGTIDDLKKIKDVLRKDIELTIEKGKTFDYISGIENIAETMKFDPEIIGRILSNVNYDYVIVDLGFSPVFPLCFSGLKSVDKRIYIVDQSERSRSRFKKIFFDVIKGLDIDLSSDEIWINKERKNGVQYSKSEIEEMFPLSVKSLPYIENAYLSEIEKKTLINKSSFKKAINKNIKDAK